MARSDFGGTGYDFVADLFDFAGRKLLGIASAELTFWTAQTGGTQYTDLLVDGSPASTVMATEAGVPSFKGPNGVKTMWASVGGGTTRFLIVAFAAELLLLAPGVPVPASTTAIGTLIFRTS